MQTKLPRSLIALPYCIDITLIAIYVAAITGVFVNYYLFQLFDLDGENTIPAWFSSSQLFLSACVFGSAALIKEKNSAAPIYYLAWSLALFFLSADEIAGFHEKITLIFRDVEFMPRFPGNHGIWIPLYTIVGSLFIFFIAAPSRRIYKSGNNGILILFLGVAIFVFGAVIIEIISYGEFRNLENLKKYRYLVTLEEGFELIGVSTILIGSAVTCYRIEFVKKRAQK